MVDDDLLDEAIELYDKGVITRGEFRGMLYKAFDVKIENAITIGSCCTIPITLFSYHVTPGMRILDTKTNISGTIGNRIRQPDMPIPGGFDVQWDDGTSSVDIDRVNDVIILDK